MNRREFLKRGLEGIAIGSIPLIYNCSKNPVESEPEGRIIPGKSIDSVYLGDTIDTVEKKLGSLGREPGWDEVYGSEILDYIEGPHAGLMIFFGHSIFSIDAIESLFVKSPYYGTTKEGIGIGSSLVSVHDFYGMPDKIYSNENTTRWESYYSNYYSNNAAFTIKYEDNYISYIELCFVQLLDWLENM